MQTPYTEQQKQDFKDEFEKRRSRQMRLVIPVIVLTAFGLYWRHGGKDSVLSRIPEAYLAPVIVVGVLGMIGFSLYNWRCPACRGYLGRDVSTRFCKSCGVELRS